MGEEFKPIKSLCVSISFNIYSVSVQNGRDVKRLFKQMFWGGKTDVFFYVIMFVVKEIYAGQGTYFCGRDPEYTYTEAIWVLVM